MERETCLVGEVMWTLLLCVVDMELLTTSTYTVPQGLLLFFASVILAQISLVLKKKQFELCFFLGA
jgi:hypothetical protein